MREAELLPPNTMQFDARFSRTQGCGLFRGLVPSGLPPSIKQQTVWREGVLPHRDPQRPLFGRGTALGHIRCACLLSRGAKLVLYF